MDDTKLEGLRVVEHAVANALLQRLYPNFCGHTQCRDDEGVPITCTVRDEQT